MDKKPNTNPNQSTDRPIPRNTNHLSTAKVFGLLSNKAIQKLHTLNIHTAEDMLNAPLYKLASVTDISLQTWQKILSLSIKWGHYKTTLTPPLNRYAKKNPYQIQQLNLPTRIINCLAMEGVTTLEKLAQFTLGDAICTRNLGTKSTLKLIAFLAENQQTIPIPHSKEPPLDINPTNSLKTANTTPPLITAKQYQQLQQHTTALHKITVNRLALPFSLTYQLFTANIITIQTLISQTPSQLASHNFSNTQITLISKTLQHYCNYLLSQPNWHTETTNGHPNPLQLNALKQTNLTNITQEICNCLSPKYNHIINMVYGLDDGKAKTLKQVGQSLNITQTRVAQLKEQAIEQLKKYIQFGLIPPLINLLETHIKTALDGIFTINQLQPYVTTITNTGSANFTKAITLLLLQYPETFVYVTEKTIWGFDEEIINLVPPSITLLTQIFKQQNRPLSTAYLTKQVIALTPDLEDNQSITNSLFTLASNYKVKDKNDIINNAFIERCLSINNKFVQQTDKTWIPIKWQYKRHIIIINMLRQLKQPTHFEKIAQLANATVPPAHQGSNRVYLVCLQQNEDLFIRTDKDTYGLTEWEQT